MKVEQIASHGAEIWKVELAAWLHVFGRLNPNFVTARGPAPFWCGWVHNKPGADQSIWRGICYCTDVELGPKLVKTAVKLGKPFDDAGYCVGRLIELWEKRFASLRQTLDQVLAFAHAEANGEEKRSVRREIAETDGDRVWDPTLLSQPKNLPWWTLTPFGFPTEIYPNEQTINDRQTSAATQAKALLAVGSTCPPFDGLRKLLSLGLDDSSVPICDIRLSDVGLMSAAFAKAAVVESLITATFRGEDLQWRLLRLAVDGLGYVSAPARIADVLTRKRILCESLDEVRKEMERRGLFGTEVYRDEYGPVFVVPGFESPADRKKFDRFMAEKIETCWHGTEAGKDLQFAPFFSPPFGIGAHKGYAHQLGALLRFELSAATPRPSAITSGWSDVEDGHQSDVCTACGIRPIGPDCCESRRICTVCYRRREHRVRDWLEDPADTIWLDEAADENGRVAAIAARFRIESWLIGPDGGKSYLEETIFQKKPDAKDPFNIAPSSARLRRIFETLDQFWMDARASWDLMAAWRRVALTPAISWKWQRNFAYELEHQASGVRIAAVWTGAEFLIIDHRLRIERGAGKILSNMQGELFRVRIPSGYRKDAVALERTAQGEFTVNGAREETAPFSQWIEILHDPRQFIGLMPAREALQCAEQMKALFEKHFGRVRNRLGLDVSVIAAPADTPLRALLDAAHRSLKRPVPVEHWKICCATEIAEERIKIRFANGIEWDVPFGFPFYIAEKNPPNSKARDHYFPYFQTSDGHLLHVTELRPGYVVRVEPSTLDFEFLDSSSRRFELTYDDNGQRRCSEPGDRPILLEKIEEMQGLWEVLDGQFSRSQIRILDGLLAAQRAEWSEIPDAFIHAAIRNMERKPGVPDATYADTNRITAAARSGMLHDCIEWYLGVCKERDAKTPEEGI